MNAGTVCPRDGRADRGRTGGDQQVVIVHRAAVVERDMLDGGVEPDGAPADKGGVDPELGQPGRRQREYMGAADAAALLRDYRWIAGSSARA